MRMTDILTAVAGALGRIKLNRPKAINAPKLGMIQDIASKVNKETQSWLQRSHL
jgi:enoyl-CoA hydratase/carnithine racemase